MNVMRTPPSPRINAKYRKIMLYCGIPLGVVLLVFLAVFLYYYQLFRRFKNEYTEEKPAVIRHEAVNQRQQAQLNVKYNTIKDVVKNHKKAELKFTSDEFSQLIAYSPETKGFADKARFWLEGDKVKADLSISLDGVPRMQGRHLNGIFTFSLSIRDGKMHLHIDDCIVKGKPIDASYLKLLNSRNPMQLLSRQNDTSFMEYIDTLEVVDGKLIVNTR
ncbi:MAG: hypothetical protein J5746_04490 [Victivallales bacterium]|nr:hypothetical protein [Victivallales bacterium]